MTVACLERPVTPDEVASQLPIDEFNRAAGGGKLELSYVHQAALAEVAASAGSEQAQVICDGLSSVRMRRIVGHHLMAHVLSEPEIDERKWVRSAADAEYQWARAIADKELNIIDGGRPKLRWLSQMHGVATIADRPRYYPLLPTSRKIINSCFDDGFYTFAFTDQASDWMYADDEPFSSMLPAIAQSDGPGFLTVVRGGQYSSDEFDTPELAGIPSSIALAETVYLHPDIRCDMPPYVTLPIPTGERLAAKELAVIEKDSREFYVGVAIDRIQKRVGELRYRAASGRRAGRDSHAITDETKADLLNGSIEPLQKVFEMRHFSTSGLNG